MPAKELALSQVYPEPAKMKKQMEFANRKQIPFVILIGEDEISSNTYTLKDMDTGEQSKLSLAELIDHLTR